MTSFLSSFFPPPPLSRHIESRVIARFNNDGPEARVRATARWNSYKRALSEPAARGFEASTLLAQIGALTRLRLCPLTGAETTVETIPVTRVIEEETLRYEHQWKWLKGRRRKATPRQRQRTA